MRLRRHDGQERSNDQHTTQYEFDGFFRPIVNDATNVVSAGSAVPAKFRVRNHQGNLVTDLDAVASIVSVKVSCDTGLPATGPGAVPAASCASCWPTTRSTRPSSSSDEHLRSPAGNRHAVPVDAQIRWFGWREVQPALAHAASGGIALHHFRWDLRRYGLGVNAPACHILSADRPRLIGFAADCGLPEWLIQAPRRHRPDIWHFDAFGPVLTRLQTTYPPPDGLE